MCDQLLRVNCRAVAAPINGVDMCVDAQKRRGFDFPMSIGGIGRAAKIRELFWQLGSNTVPWWNKDRDGLRAPNSAFF